MTIHDPPSVSTDVTHLEFELADPAYPFVGLSTVQNSDVKLEEILPRRTGGYRGIYTITDADPDAALRQADTYEDSDPQLLSRREDGGVLELCTAAPSPTMYLAEGGALPRHVSAAQGEGRITAELVSETSETDIVESFLLEHDTAELVAHRQESYHTPMFSHRELDTVVTDRLTDRQHEVLCTAYKAGYFEWPRATSGEELAETLDITAPTFAQHLRAAERKLISLLFD